MEDCRSLLTRNGYTIGHTLGEGKRVADKLAKRCIDQESHMVNLISPLVQISDLFEADRSGNGHSL